MRNQLFPVPLSLHTLSFTGAFCMISWQPLHSSLISARFEDRMSKIRDDGLEMLLVGTADLLDFLHRKRSETEYCNCDLAGNLHL